jgi:hypothetical protein
VLTRTLISSEEMRLSGSPGEPPVWHDYSTVCSRVANTMEQLPQCTVHVYMYTLTGPFEATSKPVN